MMNGRSKSNRIAVRKAAYGGIVTAISLTALFISGSGIVPFNRLSFYALSTMFIFIMQIEFGPSSAFITFGATSLLAFMIVPNKIILIPYILFFGYYGIIKNYIEGTANLLSNRMKIKWHVIFFILEWVVKIVIFSGAMLISYFIIEKLFSRIFSEAFMVNFSEALKSITEKLFALGFSPKHQVATLVIIAIMIFVVYDIAYSMVISYYNRRWGSDKNEV